MVCGKSVTLWKYGSAIMSFVEGRWVDELTIIAFRVDLSIPGVWDLKGPTRLHQIKIKKLVMYMYI